MIERNTKMLLNTTSHLIYDAVLDKVSVSDSNVNVKVNYDKSNQNASITPGKIDKKLSLKKHKIDVMDISSPELVTVLFLFATGLSSGVVTNTWLRSYCLLLPNTTVDNCTGVIPPSIENEVQPHVATMILIKTVIETLFPGLGILFIGTWSDSHGRRPLWLLSLFGFTVSFTIWAILASQTYMEPGYFLIASIPVGLTGGLTTFFLSMVCAISDMTTLEDRAFKMAVFEAACMFGTFTSQLLTARISSGPYGFSVAFGTSAAICFIALVYIYFFFPETVTNTQRVEKKGYLLDVFKTFFKKRPNHTRAVLYLAITANTAYILIVFGEVAVFYLNVQKRFAWELQDYANFNSYSVVLSGFVLYFGTWLVSSVLRLRDLTGLLIVSIPRICSSLLYAFCKDWRLLYVGISIGCISTLITPLYRSEVSKLVPSHELGKVMSVIMFLEACTPVTSASLYTTVYNWTIEAFPGAVFLVSAGLSVICTCFIMFCLIIEYIYPSQDFSILSEQRGSEDNVINRDRGN